MFSSVQIYQNLSKVASYNSLDILLIIFFCFGYFLFRLGKIVANKKGKSIPKEKSIVEINKNLKEKLLISKNNTPVKILNEIKAIGYTPDTTTFNTMLDFYINVGNEDYFNETLKIMMEEDVVKDIVTFNTLLKGKNRELDRVQNKSKVQNQINVIIEELNLAGIKTNLITWNTLLDSAIKSKNMSSITDIVSNILKNQEIPDEITFSILVKGMRSQFSLHKKIELFNEIKRLINEGNCCNGAKRALLAGYFQCKKIKEAIEVYKTIKSNEMDQLTLRELLKGFGDYKLLNILNEMRENFYIDPYSVSFLLHALVKCGDIEGAMDILKTEENFSTVNCTILLKGLAENGRVEESLMLFEEMKSKEKSQPNLITYNTLLNILVAKGEIENLRNVLESMKASPNIGIDLITASTFIKGLFKCKMVEEATDYFNKLSEENSAIIDEVLYNIMMNGYVNNGQPEKAIEIYKKMTSSGKEACKVTYSILIRANADLQNYEETLKVIKEMKNKGEDIGKIVYTCLLSACKKLGKFELIDNIYEEMKLENAIDECAADHLVSCFLQAGNFIKASEVLIGGFEKEVIPQPKIVFQLLNKLTKEASKIIESVENQKMFSQIEKIILSICVQLNKRNIELESKLIKNIVKVICRKRCIELGIHVGVTSNHSRY